tara:strand:- start:3005 stop:4117 length:1113 start_codon:yes stop_codon:yes gene_type:complete
MAVNNYKHIDPAADIATVKTPLHEAIPISGNIIRYQTGTYVEANIKDYTHGQFQSIYDYPYLSSSANHIFDLTVGFSAFSEVSGNASSGSNSGLQVGKKQNMYNQFAQCLMGYSGSGSQIRRFESDLSLDLDADNTMNECVFISFSRLLVKDEIKKGTFSITLGQGTWDQPHHGDDRTLSDSAASETGGTMNVAGGDAGVLVDGLASGSNPTGMGLVFYQAGIAVITASAFGSPRSAGHGTGSENPEYFNTPESEVLGWKATFASSSISGNCNAARHRIQNISFNNTTEINSTIYYCRINHRDFNYSSNPTYLSNSKIRVKNVATDNPITYITTVGLYGADNALLAVAKLSEPLRKDPTNELVLRVRLDY